MLFYNYLLLGFRFEGILAVMSVYCPDDINNCIRIAQQFLFSNVVLEICNVIM